MLTGLWRLCWHRRLLRRLYEYELFTIRDGEQQSDSVGYCHSPGPGLEDGRLVGSGSLGAAGAGYALAAGFDLPSPGWPWGAPLSEGAFERSLIIAS
jgi:hypothetical protein